MILKILFFLLLSNALAASVQVGADVLFAGGYSTLLQGKKIGLITNQSAVNKKLETTFSLLKKGQKEYTLAAVFVPEHGFHGSAYAFEEVKDGFLEEIPLYTLFGVRRRPTKEMLVDLDLLIFDIQDVGTRSYTYISTLFYCMEEAAKAKIPFVVLDRPNPMGGIIVDGPPVNEERRSFLGYINVPYCHGLTVGELACLFNEEYKVGCLLTVIPMKGWKREMAFSQTGLPWVPTSPQIPEPDTPFFYPTTGIMGHCSLVNIGIGYTLPFKLVGAPWIDAEELASTLNQQKLPGVHFQPFYFRPFYGKFVLENCQGVRIVLTDPNAFLPVTTQFTIMGVLKNLYPKKFEEAMHAVSQNANKKDVFIKLTGSEEILNILCKEKYFIWKLRNLCAQAREAFLPIRKKYLLSDYK